VMLGWVRLVLYMKNVYIGNCFLNWIELNFIQDTTDMYKLKTKYTIMKYPVNYIGYAL
jgi:hypothetical protein